MQEDRMHAGIAKQDFQAALRGRIMLEDSLNLLSNSAKHLDLRDGARSYGCDWGGLGMAGPRPATDSSRD